MSEWTRQAADSLRLERRLAPDTRSAGGGALLSSVDH
jgi:hypothetical protein